jgi:hypothetical protein
MRELLRGVALTAVAGLISCSAAAHSSSVAQNEYRWALSHGACECGPIAYAPKSTAPSWNGEYTYAAYVHDKIASCASRQFIVVAFGDGDNDFAGDMELARARAEPVVRLFSGVKTGRLDTITFAGPHIAHPSTLEVLCPIARLPAQNAF